MLIVASVCRRRRLLSVAYVLWLNGAYRKSYMRNRFVPKWMTLTVV